MRTRTSLLVLLAIAGPFVAAGCRSHERHAPPGGVGFELPGNPLVARGALLTQPPGQEEAFVPFVAGGAPAWIEACRQEAGATPPLFVLETDAAGVLRPAASDSSATPRDKCLATRAAGTPAKGLPGSTRVTVQLALRGP
jgi:hypothetical protein